LGLSCSGSLATHVPLKGPLERLERLSIARVARGIQHGHNDDRADLPRYETVTPYGTAWHGAESTELRDTLCSFGFSLIASRPARAHQLLISIPIDGTAHPSCENDPFDTLLPSPSSGSPDLLSRRFHPSYSSKPRTRPGTGNLSLKLNEADGIAKKTPNSQEALERSSIHHEKEKAESIRSKECLTAKVGWLNKAPMCEVC